MSRARWENMTREEWLAWSATATRNATDHAIGETTLMQRREQSRTLSPPHRTRLAHPPSVDRRTPTNRTKRTWRER